MWQRVVDCLGIAVEVASHVPAIEDQLAAVFRTYANAGAEPQISYRLQLGDWPELVRDGRLVARHDRVLDLVAALEVDLYTQVVARARGLVLHAAAAVGNDGRALVFAGPSGAGKSTVLRALLARGYAYLTEECVALRESAQCVGLARPMHVDDDAIAVPHGFSCDEYVLRTAAGPRRTRLFHPPAHAIWRDPATAVAVIALGHGPTAPDRVERLTVGAAVAALWPAVFRNDPSDALDAMQFLAAPALYSLQTRSAERAVDLTLALAEELGVALP